MSEVERKYDEYFLGLLQIGLPPSEVEQLTVDQFDIACRWIDARNKEASK